MSEQDMKNFLALCSLQIKAFVELSVTSKPVKPIAGKKKTEEEVITGYKQMDIYEGDDQGISMSMFNSMYTKHMKLCGRKKRKERMAESNAKKVSDLSKTQLKELYDTLSNDINNFTPEKSLDIKETIKHNEHVTSFREQKGSQQSLEKDIVVVSINGVPVNEVADYEAIFARLHNKPAAKKKEDSRMSFQGTGLASPFTVKSKMLELNKEDSMRLTKEYGMSSFSNNDELRDSLRGIDRGLLASLERDVAACVTSI